MTGPLAPFADAYEPELKRRGYTRLTAVSQLRQVARLSRWLEASGLTVAELNGERVEEFLVFQRAGGRDRARGHARACCACWMCCVGWGCWRSGSRAAAGSPTEVLLASFERYLLAERGLAAGTVGGVCEACAPVPGRALTGQRRGRGDGGVR